VIHSHKSIEPDQLYFAILDARVLDEKRPTTRQLGFLFEATLPVPLESIHAIYRPFGDNQYLACGIDRDRLRELATEAVVTLTPSSFPEGVPATIHPDEMNFLTGEFEPQGVTTWRRLHRRTMAAAAILMVGLVVLGLERRSAFANQAVDQLEQDRRQTIASVLGNQANSHPHPDLLVTSERRLLEQTRSPGSIAGGNPLSDLEAADVSILLAQTLSRIPQDLPLRIESLVVTPQTITLTGEAQASVQAQALADPLATLEGWTLQQPRFDSHKDGVNFSLRLTRKAGSP
jgi:hypothetical protein